MTVRILGVVALITFMAFVPAQAQEGMTLTLGRLLHQPPSLLQQSLSVTNGTGKIAKLVQVECGFFNEGQLIAAGTSVVQNVSPNTTGYTQIAVVSDSTSDHVDCRIASVQLADTPAATDPARQTAPAQSAVVVPGDAATPAVPNEKVDAVAVNIGMAYAVTNSDLCINYKSSYKISDENVMKYMASESVPADEVNARLNDKTFLGKVGRESVSLARDPKAGCDEIIRRLGPSGIGLLQPVSTADNKPARNSAGSSSGRGQAPAQAQETGCTVTLSQYQQLETGMSYAQVTSILGCEGTEITRSEIAGLKTVMYMWQGDSLGANMNVMLQNDRLTLKAQFGLR